jgi:hypothetical protein
MRGVFGLVNISGNNTKTYRVTGLTFNAVNDNNGMFEFDASSMNGKATGIRVDHNWFKNIPSGHLMFTTGDYVSGNCAQTYGVIDHNTFTGSTYYSVYHWVDTIVPSAPCSFVAHRGTANNMFIEDNTITMVNSDFNALGGNGACTDAFGNAAWVIRNNTSTNCDWASHGVDHGGGPANIEYYGNKCIMTGGVYGALQDGTACFYSQGSNEMTEFNNTVTPILGHGNAMYDAHYRDGANYFNNNAFGRVGLTTAGSGTDDVSTNIHCTKFTSAPYIAGTAYTMNLQFGDPGGTRNAKLLLYSNAGSLLAQTGVFQVASGGGIFAAGFTAYPTLSASTPYILCVFSDGGGLLPAYYNNGTSGDEIIDTTATWPTPNPTLTTSSTGSKDYAIQVNTTCDGTSPVDDPSTSGWPGNNSPIATYQGYPCWHQPGRDTAGNLSPLYGFNNYFSDNLQIVNAQLYTVNASVCSDGASAPPCSPVYSSQHLKAERDIYISASNAIQSDPTTPFNGTTGVGIGTLANRPSTCTPTTSTLAADAGKGGVGYWAVDQGSWNSGSMTYQVGGIGTAYSQGVLYTCTATNTWTLSYTPYAYPHPLTITVPTAPSISSQPASQTIGSGATANLTVVATGSTPFTYQWYQGTSGTTTTPVGTNSSNFTTPALTTTTSYWVQVSNSLGSVNSNTATITVVAAAAPGIATQPASQTISSGATATLSVVATGTAPFTYQWYQGITGTTTPVGTNSSSFTTPALTTTTNYWVQVTNSAGSVNSNTATITIFSSAPAITAQPLSQGVPSGSTATLSVVAGGTAPLTYQWYQGTSGTTTTPVGTNSSSFTTPPVTATTSYWVQVSNSAGSANSITANVGIGTGPSISVVNPLNGSTVSGTTTVSTFPTSSVGIAGVQFQLDKANLGPAVTTASSSGRYSINWMSTTTTNASHTLSAVVTDLNGYQSASPPITVMVSNVVPTALHNIPANGGFSVSTTTDSNTTTQVSHALIQQDTATTSMSTSVPDFSGVAIIGYRPSGVLVSEAGVPATPQIMSGRLYADVSHTVNTGIALSNLTPNDATVTFYFTDVTGTDFGSGSLTLPANTQFATFLNQSPLYGPPAFQGSFTFSSTVPIGAIALRGLTNERGEFLFTTVPVAPVGTSPNAYLLPEFVNGAGWTTSLLLTNASSSVETGTIQFFGQGSGSANAPLLNMSVNGASGTSFNYSIPAHSSARFDTSGGTSIQVGSIRVTPVSSSNDVPSAVSIFQLRENGITISETSVIAAPVSTGFQLYTEAAGVTGLPGSIQSGLAVVNPASTPAVVRLDLSGLDGTPTGLPTATITIPPGGQISTFINQLFPGMPASFQGIANLSSATPVAVAALRGRYNERADFLMTTTPPLNVLSASPGTLEFPEVASGGGFGTQIIAFSKNGGLGRLYVMTSSGVLEPSSSLH